jgi:hypothetical protein
MLSPSMFILHIKCLLFWGLFSLYKEAAGTTVTFLSCPFNYNIVLMHVCGPGHCSIKQKKILMMLSLPGWFGNTLYILTVILIVFVVLPHCDLQHCNSSPLSRADCGLLHRFRLFLFWVLPLTFILTNFIIFQPFVPCTSLPLRIAIFCHTTFVKFWEYHSKSFRPFTSNCYGIVGGL